VIRYNVWTVVDKHFSMPARNDVSLPEPVAGVLQQRVVAAHKEAILSQATEAIGGDVAVGDAYT
jgi:hypothetical protein